MMAERKYSAVISLMFVFRSLITLLRLTFRTSGLVFAAVLLLFHAHGANAAIRNYYIAAENVSWDYAPSGLDLMHGSEIPFPWTIHRKWPKTRFIEYTDGTFTKRKPQPEWLGILGPIIRAEVGDTLLVHFRNKDVAFHSIHVHGLRYDKRNEGAVYGANLPGTGVPPGKDFVYRWVADMASGPPAGESSRLWLYHGHVDEPVETNSGLIGPVIVTAKGRTRPDGSPRDVQREFIALFMIFDEMQGKEDGLLHTINGYIYSNLPGLIMNEGERVRWYLAAMGNERDAHSAHWHGKTVFHHGRSEDVIPLLPAQTETVDMVADNPGTWMFQCHVADHIESGMMALYRIRPAHPRACPVQFDAGNFWSASPALHLQLRNNTAKVVERLVLETEALTGPNHLERPEQIWKFALPLASHAETQMEMPNPVPDPRYVEAWVIFPVLLKFADGTEWTPRERGECVHIYWRDKVHQNLEILPLPVMPSD
jgi:multicopper oxidase